MLFLIYISVIDYAVLNFTGICTSAGESESFPSKDVHKAF